MKWRCLTLSHIELSIVIMDYQYLLFVNIWKKYYIYIEVLYCGSDILLLCMSLYIQRYATKNKLARLFMPTDL